MFRGHIQHAMDEKGRVALPARFREALSALQDERLVLTQFRYRGHNCLDGYPFSTWRQLEQRILGNSRFDPENSDLIDAYVSAAVDCQIDNQGRILVPPNLRDYAGLQREVMFTGRIDMFRMWDQRDWAIVSAESRKIFDDTERLKSLKI